MVGQRFFHYLKCSAILPFLGRIAFYVAKIEHSLDLGAIGTVANALSMAMAHIELPHISL